MSEHLKDAIVKYIEHCLDNDHRPEMIVLQLQLFCMGIRDGRLGDAAIILIDGDK